jgi:hypothetical protein
MLDTDTTPHASTDITTAWLDQTTPGTVVLATFAGVVARLVVDDEHHAAGPFLPEVAEPVETAAADRVARLSRADVLTLCAGYGEAQPAGIERDDYENPGFALLLRLLLPDLTLVGRTYDGSEVREYMWGEADTRSWVRFIDEPDEPGLMIQSGPRRLGEQITDLYERWIAAGRPDVARLGLTVNDYGTWLWADDPQHRIGQLPDAA